ncbi:M15 family metallopeptidase [Synechocystis salina]|uniref:D-alanyl-D-alanine dipeptidase n=1 Tax=Synechocystis salina LEGE 00031 TaxID=1828736 RepID=A0ABR9VRI7_9SYNC|nr:M15 family metallopeptidase [Synechocystis salina]MBE9240663.1 D-alanyl-D-alanine dipeptidase [Synechocystis salina LEGE 00041]MBE9253937.1 D-alanyl-D-alanine dipeptidase [Synechocystis salina LEGE 00031]
MKPYLAVPIEDCGEPLAPINLEGVKLLKPHPYEILGADYQGRSPYVLRTGVLKRLGQARLTLADIKPTWEILVFDAYRPIAVQQFMVDHTFAEIVARDGLQGQSLTPEQRENIYQQVYQIWAVPSSNPLTPPPHSTGAALDITLLDGSGQPVNMGGEIDELSARSQPNYYQTAQAESDSQKEEFKLYQQRRELLNTMMESAGFLRHPGEWWHFSLGDQLWAWQYNQHHPDRQKIAYYGRVE